MRRGCTFRRMEVDGSVCLQMCSQFQSPKPMNFCRRLDVLLQARFIDFKMILVLMTTRGAGWLYREDN